MVSGVPAVRDPGDLVRALRSLELRAHPLLVRVFAVMEVLAGAGSLLLPGRPTFAVVALLHAGFTAFVLLALKRGGVLASCGCFGRADTPPTRSHAVVTALLAVAAVAVAIAPPAEPWWALGPGVAATTALLAALVGFLAWQVMAVLPATSPAAIRSTGRSST